MIGLVVVSHSAALADGVLELAAQMAGPDVRMSAAGGLDEPGGALGTDATRVLRAIEDVWSEDGVLVLMDLGSAVLSAELALDLMDDERRRRVRLTSAPLVEGTVAAAVAASLGDPLDAVAAAAAAGLTAKAAHLREGRPDAEGAAPAAEGDAPADQHANRAAAAKGEAGPADEAHRPGIRVRVRNRLGLHARPAALLVRTAAGFEADVRVSDLTNHRGPVNARSLNGVGTLGAAEGDELLLTADGPQAPEALAALGRLADQGFGEPADLAAPSAAPEGYAVPPGERGAVMTAGEGYAVPAGETGAGTAGVSPQSGAGRAESVGPPPAGTVIRGLPAAPGTVVGPARLLRRQAPALAVQQTADPTAEWSALERAIAATARDVRRARASVSVRAGAQEAAIFDAHLLFLEDEALLQPSREAVFSCRRPAARAWADAIAAAAAGWDALTDPYQRARAADLRAVGDQVLAHLRANEPGPEARAAGISDGGSATGSIIGPAAIVVAADLSPSDVAGLDPAAVAGIACAYGGPTSHAVILARALGLPAVVGAGAELLAVPEGESLALDGDAGSVTVAPPQGALLAVQRRREALALQAAAARAAASEPAVTLDGVTVLVEANIAGPRDAAAAVAAGADGVGLLRTEFLFMDATVLPDEDEQAAAYDAVAAALSGRPLTVRTLDAGADKPLPALPLEAEANPFLGMRGLRLSLRHPEQLRCQLRALLRVAAARPLRIMLPMVSTVDELRRVREILEEARESLESRAVSVPARPALGIMLEVPSAALVAEHLAPLADFFSVGTNDLTQYVMAAERGNAAVAALADPLHPAVLRLIGRAASAAAAADRPVAVCGEIAGDRLVVPLLLGLGIRELSMNPASIPAAKQAVRAVDLTAARALAAAALAAASPAEVRDLLAGAVRS